MLDGMDGTPIRHAALTTVRRAILRRFLPGSEREKRLEWLAQAVAQSRAELLSKVSSVAFGARSRRNSSPKSAKYNGLRT